MTPFQRETLEDDFVVQDVVSVKLNAEERLMLNALKKYYKTKADSTALKNEAFRVIKQNKIFSDLLRK